MNEGRKAREKKIYEELSGTGQWDYFMWDLDLMRRMHHKLNLWHQRMLESYLVNKRVLVLGCGSGAGISTLGHYASSIVGVDISRRAIDQAKANLSESSAIFIEGDAENLSFADRSFDVVYCKAILHHLNMKKALAEIKRVLTPGGYLYVVAEPGLLNPVAWLRRTFFPSRIHTPDEKPFIPSQFRRFLCRHGFKEIAFHPNFILSPVVPVLAKKLPKIKWYIVLQIMLFIDKLLLATPAREFSWLIVGVYCLQGAKERP